MRYRDLLASSFTAPLCLALTACGSGEAPVASMRETESPTQALEFTSTFPDGLVVVGDGYPQSGNACRRLGESKATADWLDDSAVLIGCPTEISAEGLGGEIVGNVAGISIVSLPMDDANARMISSAIPAYGEGDARVPGTEYNALARVFCAVDSGKTGRKCSAGVKRKWGKDAITLVEITRPGGLKRTIFFRGAQAYDADRLEGDGSSSYDFKATRQGDESVIIFGPERYFIPDALVLGG